jgi:hypothetical protein
MAAILMIGQQHIGLVFCRIITIIIVIGSQIKIIYFDSIGRPDIIACEAKFVPSPWLVWYQISSTHVSPHGRS